MADGAATRRPARRAPGPATAVLAVLASLAVLGGLAPPAARAQDGPPANDDFAAAVPLAGATGSVAGSSEGATVEPGEPLESGGATVWYRWVAEATDAVTFSTAGSSYDTTLGVYTGDTVDALEPVGFNDDFGGELTSSVTFLATAGAEYRIQVGGFSGGTGDLRLGWVTGAPPPPNDDFAAAVPIDGSSGQVSGSNGGATSEPGEATHAGTGTASVWYRWVAPSGGTFRFRTTGSDFDTVLAVYTGGAVDSLALVAANDNLAGGGSQVDFDATLGTAYAIAVSGAFGATGSLVLTWLPVTGGPANDLFLEAQPIEGLSGTVTGSTDGATREPGEPPHAQDDGGHTVWFRWTPPESRVVTFSTQASSFNSTLAVYTGGAVDRLSRVVSGRHTLAQPFVYATATFLALGGTEYRIAIDGLRSSTGPLALSWSSLVPPPDDDLADATPLDGSAGSVTGDSTGATPEPFEPVLGREASVWFRWTAPTDGAWRFTTEGTGFDTLLGVFTTGKHEEDLQEVAVNDDVDGFGGPETSEVAFAATAGTAYVVMLDGGGGPCFGGCPLSPMGTYTLAWAEIPLPANDDLADAAVLAGDRGRLVAWTFGATREPSEPDHAGHPGAGSIWYRWTAPEDGRVRFETSTTEPALLAVYTGTGHGDLTRVGGRGPGVLNRVAFTTESGRAYLLAVDGTTPTRVRLDWRPVPVNDDFSEATLLAGPSGSVTTSNLDATREPGEPDHAGRLAARSLWFRWTAPATGPAVFYTHGSAGDTVLSAWTGDSLGTLSPVAAGDDQGFSRASEIRFEATAGVTYRVAVDTRAGEEGTIVLSWAPPPANDHLTAASPLTGPSGEVRAASHGATTEGGEHGRPGVGRAGASVWYRWTAPAGGLFLFDADLPNGLLFDLVRGDTFPDLRLVETLPSPTSGNGLVVEVGAGDVITVVVAGRRNAPGSPTTGAFSLRWQPLPSPANDDVAAAVEISGPSGRVGVTTVGATAEAGEPPHAGQPATTSVWFRWTAPSAGPFTFETSAADFDTRLAFYTGSGERVHDLVPIAENDDAAGTTLRRSRLRVHAVAGADYLIAVDAAGRFGRASLLWDPTPANDDFAAATGIAGTSGQVTSGLRGASREVGEPRHGPFDPGSPAASVWFRWTAPVDGAVTFFAIGNVAGDLALAAYTGSAVDRLTRWPGEQASNHLTLDARAGDSYAVALEGASRRADGSVDLGWVLLPGPDNDHFAAAQAIGGAAGAIEGTTVRATNEPGEPLHAGQPGRGSVWYRWTAPTAGRFAFHSSGADTLLAAYTGSQVDRLTLLAAQDDEPGLGKSYVCPGGDCKNQEPLIDARGSAVLVDVAAGDEVRLAVDGVESGIALRWAPVPGNDELASAVVLDGAEGSVAGTTAGATLAPGDPIAFPATRHAAASHSVWYRWTAPADANIRLEVDGSAIDAVALAFEGSGYHDLRLPEPRRLGFQARAGRPYLFTVLSAFYATGPFGLRWHVVPDNDDIERATRLDGAGGSVTGTTRGATREESEPTRSGSDLAGTVWYRWTAPADGAYRFSLAADHDAVLDVFEDPALDGFKRVDTLPEFGHEGNDHIVFMAAAGEVHLLRVSSVGTSSGSFTLTWDDPPPYVAVGDVFPQEEGDERGDVGFVVFLSWPSTVPVEVGYTTVDGSAAAPGDYAATAGTFVVPPGQTGGVIVVPVVDDALDEDDETFALRLVEPLDAVVTRGEGAATVLDDDAPPTASAGAAEIVEGDTAAATAEVPIVLSGPSGKPVSVEVTTVAGSAVAGDDFEPVRTTVSIPPGHTGTTLLVSVRPDVAIEGTETFSVVVTGAVNAVVGSPALVSIVDEDEAPVLGALEVSGPVPVGDAASLSLPFVDRDAGDAHTALVSWGDGSSSLAAVLPTGSGLVVTASHTYATAGVYSLSVRIDDSGGGSATATGRAIVVDLDGQLTGGGVAGPAGAGFDVAILYLPGDVAPSGHLDARFGANRFRSTSVDWLVVAGSGRWAMVEGRGTLDGQEGYRFSLVAVDGRPDRLRLQVRDLATGALVHDTGVGADPAGEPAPLESGNVTVRAP